MSNDDAFYRGDQPPQWVIDMARDVALGIGAFPLNQPHLVCHKSQRGVVLFNPELEQERLTAGGFLDNYAKRYIAVASGRNGPPHPFTCDGGSLKCRQRCNSYCVHAEERAIRAALGNDDVHDLELVHVKVVGGQVVDGGPPSCWQCSRTILDVNLRGVWLYETMHLGNAGKGWIFRTAEAFHDETLRNCGLTL